MSGRIAKRKRRYIVASGIAANRCGQKRKVKMVRLAIKFFCLVIYIIFVLYFYYNMGRCLGYLFCLF